MRYIHTNIITKDWKLVSQFYQKVFNCVPIGSIRDLKGEWIEQLTGIKGVQIIGEHLKLPGYTDDTPTIEIFSYNNIEDIDSKKINSSGFSHIAFMVDDVEATLKILLENGGSLVGEVVEKEYENIGVATFVYAKDIEDNIIELQSWKK